MTRNAHIPVLLPQVLDALAPLDGACVIDGTFGAGGYTQAILDGGAKAVLGIDRDPRALALGAALADGNPAFRIAQGTFSRLDAIAEAEGFAPNGVVLDIGVSSMQLDEAERGFSFMNDGPLDMRMAQSGRTAADLVNETEEGALADLIYRYGEERKSRRIARAIVAARDEEPITRTTRLAEITAKAAGPGKPGRHPATRTFQALRIAVNDELGELSAALAAAERVLPAGGRLAVVTFHSLEDRIVKDFLDDRSGRTEGGSRHLPAVARSESEPTFAVARRKPVTASQAEQSANPRARSAKLRVAVRTPALARAPLSDAA